MKHLEKYSQKHKTFAFTLAEVLVTLGVIGVVAALTMPMLIDSYNKNLTEVRLKKFYSTMNQAYNMVIAERGDYTDWIEGYAIKSELSEEDPNKSLDKNEIVTSNFKTYFGKYMEFAGEKNIQSGGYTRHLFYMKDGSAFALAGYNTYDYEFFPKNAEKCLKREPAERMGSCSFPFFLFGTKDAILKGFAPYWFGLKKNEFTMETLYHGSIRSCGKGTRDDGNYCGLIIMLNGWKIPKDYPRQIRF